MDITTPPPLILTLKIDDKAQVFFNELRSRHFPAKINYLDAHLTLFHNLPAQEADIMTAIAEAAARQQQLVLTVESIVSTGKGTAYKIGNANLQEMHKGLQQRWQQWLIPQDKQKLWPHITVQNKVEPDEAKALQSALREHFVPFSIFGTGLSVWEYHNGPWKFLRTFNFSS